MVPLPPTFMRPNRQNGTESVVTTRGTTSRITITLTGSDGTSLEDMLARVIEGGGCRVDVCRLWKSYEVAWEAW
jgi:hypothetical protein